MATKKGKSRLQAPAFAPAVSEAMAQAVIDLLAAQSTEDVFAILERVSPSIFGITYDWRELRDWIAQRLPDVARYRKLAPRAAEQLRHEINERVFGSGLRLPLRLGPFGLEIDVELLNPFHWGLIGFLVPGGTDPRRLAQCQLASCGAWFLRPPPRPGMLQQYCTPAHANLAKVQAFRARQRAGKARA